MSRLKTAAQKRKDVTKKKVASPLRVGQKVFIRSITHYYTGVVAALSKDEIVLIDAAWVADTGRFSAALESGTLEEVEPFHAPVSVGRGAVVDVTYWPHPLPRGVR